MNNGDLARNEPTPELATFSTWWWCGDFNFQPTDYPAEKIESIEYCMSGLLLTTVFWSFNSSVPSSSGIFRSFNTGYEKEQYYLEWGNLWQIDQINWPQYNHWYERSYICPSCEAKIRVEGWEASHTQTAQKVVDWGVRRTLVGTIPKCDGEIIYDGPIDSGFEAYSSISVGIET